jgi:hypothetical protein
MTSTIGSTVSPPVRLALLADATRRLGASRGFPSCVRLISVLGQELPNRAMQLRRQMAGEDFSGVERDSCAVFSADRDMRKLVLLLVVEP